MSDPKLDALLWYLREHARHRSAEALREELLQGSRSPKVVDQALAAAQSSGFFTPSEPIFLHVLAVFAFNLAVFMLLPHPWSIALAPSLFVIAGGEIFLGRIMGRSEQTRQWGQALVVGGGCVFFPLLMMGGLLALQWGFYALS